MLRSLEEDGARGWQDHDIGVTNSMQWALVRMYHPEATSISELDLVAIETLSKHARHFRRLIEIDGLFRSKDRLIDLWDRKELNPRIMDFIKQVLDIMYEAESKVTALVVARDFEQQLLPLDR